MPPRLRHGTAVGIGISPDRSCALGTGYLRMVRTAASVAGGRWRFRDRQVTWFRLSLAGRLPEIERRMFLSRTTLGVACQRRDVTRLDRNSWKADVREAQRRNHAAPMPPRRCFHQSHKRLACDRMM